MLGTRDVVRKLLNEGQKVTVDFIQKRVMDGSLPSPQIVGGVRLWTDEDIERLRVIIRKGSKRKKKGNSKITKIICSACSKRILSDIDGEKCKHCYQIFCFDHLEYDDLGTPLCSKCHTLREEN